MTELETLLLENEAAEARAHLRVVARKQSRMTTMPFELVLRSLIGMDYQRYPASVEPPAAPFTPEDLAPMVEAELKKHRADVQRARLAALYDANHPGEHP